MELLQDITIKSEKADGFSEIYSLIKEAFASAEHSDGNEQDLVERLRKGRAYIPKLSLAAFVGGELAGYIMFTRGKVEAEDVLILAPLCVKPKFQRRGIGLALIKEGHRRASEMGFDYSFVLGSETYYPKAGYFPAGTTGVKTPADFPPKNFMAARLRDEAPDISGVLEYPEAFGI